MYLQFMTCIAEKYTILHKTTENILLENEDQSKFDQYTHQIFHIIQLIAHKRQKTTSLWY